VLVVVRTVDKSSHTRTGTIFKIFEFCGTKAATGSYSTSILRTDLAFLPPDVTTKLHAEADRGIQNWVFVVQVEMHP
jgi:hypothetical protein